MRVCMVNDHFYRSSGAAMAIRRIAQSLPEVVYCVAGCEGDGRIEDLSWVGEQRYRRFQFKTANPIRLAMEMARFRRWFKANGCDLVHCHHRRIAVLMQLAGIPVLYTGQLVFGPATWFRWLHPRRMTAISASVAKNILETTGRPVLACISNPAQFPAQEQAVNVERVKNKAVCVARLEPVKGHTHLLAAWKLLRDRGHCYELDLVGEGSLREKLEEQARRDGIEELIHFRGFTQDVAGIVDESLFAVLVSEYEGQGIVTLEAAAMGRASLLTAVPGSVDLLPPGRALRNGVEFQNVEELADALEEWFSNPLATVEEGRRFYEFLKNSSDPVVVAREYANVYRQVLATSA
jgi:glycosyltransferase involved in cell wall biosynthesis